MPKFRFRLQRVLGFRHLQEKWARDAYLSSRARRLEAEEQTQQIEEHRSNLLKDGVTSIPSRLALESALMRLDDDFRAQMSVIGVLADEENQLHDLWVATKREVETIEKLRVKSLDDWQVIEGRRVQAELDEWAVTRRPLA